MTNTFRRCPYCFGFIHILGSEPEHPACIAALAALPAAARAAREHAAARLTEDERMGSDGRSEMLLGMLLGRVIDLHQLLVERLGATAAAAEDEKP